MKIKAVMSGGHIITQSDLDKYIVEVGILEPDTKGNRPMSKNKGLKKFAGGEARRVKGKSKQTVGEIAVRLDEQYNWTGKAIDNDNNKDLENVIDWLAEVIVKPTQRTIRQYLNACQALVRNPILRKEFEPNKASTAKQKGFNRTMIDTGKFFSSIKARLVKGG